MWNKLSCTPVKQTTCLYNMNTLAFVLTKFHYRFCINTQNFHGQIEQFFIRGAQTNIDRSASWQPPFLAITHYFLVNIQPIIDNNTSFNALSH